MKARLMALAAGISAAWAPAAWAQNQTIDLSQGPGQHITIPGSTQGHGGPTATNFDFTLNGFQPGKNGAVCAVGTLQGGELSTPTPVSIPVQTAGHKTQPSDCSTPGGGAPGGLGGPETGSLQRLTPATPAHANASFPIGGLVIPAQIPPPPPGGCNILNLRLGPIFLNLLGLVVQTNTIVVNITGVPQAGLLGNLLCSLLGP